LPPKYRSQTLFDLLYAYVYRADRLAKPAHDKGLVVTRSWQASVTLAVAGPVQPGGKLNLRHEVEVPLPHCIEYDRDVAPNPHCYLRRRVYNEELRTETLEELRFGGCCYLSDLVALVPDEMYQQGAGYVEAPKLFRAGRRDGYRHYVWYREPAARGMTDEDKKPISLWYLAPLPSAIQDVEGGEAPERVNEPLQPEHQEDDGADPD